MSEDGIDSDGTKVETFAVTGELALELCTVALELSREEMSRTALSLSELVKWTWDYFIFNCSFIFRDSSSIFENKDS